jgi:Arc/MetJ-type ribon-helix-helix transcriptional regulator
MTLLAPPDTRHTSTYTAEVEKTTLYLPSELLSELRDAARRTGQSQAEIVRAALRSYLDQEAAPPMPKSFGAGLDLGVTGEESEAWLEREWSRL